MKPYHPQQHPRSTSEPRFALKPTVAALAATGPASSATWAQDAQIAAEK